MRNPHRLFEVDYYTPMRCLKERGSFFDHFKYVLGECLTATPQTEDPRTEINMSPEPYRPPAELETDIASLRQRAIDLVEPDLHNWEWLYEHLTDSDSKRLLLLVLAYRGLGWRYVKLPLNNDLFRSALAEIGHMVIGRAPDHFVNGGLQKFSLREADRDIAIYSDPFGIFNEFIYPQYYYRGMSEVFSPRQGDYVLDCGACYGGTTINFADAVGPEGRVYSFEFMPENIDVYHANVHANPRLQNRISLAIQPVWSESGLIMSIVGEGPATQVQFADIPDAKKVASISIDDFVETAGLPRVDLIKMDIEGAEMNALKGAARTIARFRPRMAVCVYHQLFDFYELPQFLLGINEDYKLYFGHSTTHGDESVIFAI